MEVVKWSGSDVIDWKFQRENFFPGHIVGLVPVLALFCTPEASASVTWQPGFALSQGTRGPGEMVLSYVLNLEYSNSFKC